MVDTTAGVLLVHRNQEKHHQKIANPCQHSQITEYEYTVGAETVILTKCVIFLTKTGANDVIKKIQPACRCSFGPLGVTLVPHMSTRPPTFLPTYTFRLLQLSVLDHLICFSSAVRVFFFKHSANYKGLALRSMLALCRRQSAEEGNADSIKEQGSHLLLNFTVFLFPPRRKGGGHSAHIKKKKAMSI